MSRWNDLLSQLETERETYPSLPEHIVVFENICGFELLWQFKEYCKTFGAGVFKKTDICINGIDSYSPLSQMLEDDDIRKAFAFGMDDFPYEKELIESSYMFGMGEYLTLLLWDLRTYSEIDDSYDIYILKDRNIDVLLCNLGRDFYTFVRDFCMGQNVTQDFADLLELEMNKDRKIIGKPNSFLSIRYEPLKPEQLLPIDQQIEFHENDE
jgi:hypothetical protein